MRRAIQNGINDEEMVFHLKTRSLTTKEEQKHHLTQEMDNNGLHFQGLGVILGVVLLSGFGHTAEKSDNALIKSSTHSLLFRNGSQVNGSSLVTWASGNTSEIQPYTFQNESLMNGSRRQPRVQALRKTCSPENEAFCLNGVCSYVSELNVTMCRCHKNFTGQRCELALMYVSHRFSSPEEVIAITCGVLLFMGIIIAVVYFCLRKRCRSSPPYKNTLNLENVI
ncbi:hypothetical protein DNTS_023686 [Danionella cerebrum]|uniref:EGF-like domain-containing protein n=1 Tax=Danionella cerebrum TaxID=2873325 RepID=A0A553MMK4_9TELE|nr:hypothetical protein DNTS_023686 [Danionella translucida]